MTIYYAVYQDAADPSFIMQAPMSTLVRVFGLHRDTTKRLETESLENVHAKLNVSRGTWIGNYRVYYDHQDDADAKII